MSSLLINRQAKAEVFQTENGFDFIWDRRKHHFKTMEAVRKFFYEQTDLDTVKFKTGSKKEYVHFSSDSFQIYTNKNPLRDQLSRECSGAWGEKTDGATRYFKQESGWLRSQVKEITYEEASQLNSDSSSTLQKVWTMGLGVLGIFSAAKTRMSFVSSTPGLVSLFGMSSVVSGQNVEGSFSVGDFGFPIIDYLGNDQLAAVYGNEQEIYVQITKITGDRIGQQFRVIAQDGVGNPNVKKIESDQFLVVWDSSDDIYGQKFDQSGNKIGLPYLVNIDDTGSTVGTRSNAGIAVLTNNTYAIAWGKEGQIFDDEAGTSIPFSPDPVGPPWYTDARIAAGSDSKFAFIYGAEATSGNSDIYAQIFHENGTSLAAPFQINTFSDFGQGYPSIAKLENGNFVTTWESEVLDGDAKGVFGQLLSSYGEKIGSEFQVNTRWQGEQEKPNVAALDSGGFVVVWATLDGSQNESVVFQRFDENANPIEGEIEATPFDGLNTRPKVVGVSGGRFLVAYNRNGDTGAILFDANGERVPYIPPNTQTSPSMQSANPTASLNSQSGNSGTPSAPLNSQSGSSSAPPTPLNSQSGSSSAPPTPPNTDQDSGDVDEASSTFKFFLPTLLANT